MTYDPDEVRIANRTSRNTGAVGKSAILPKYIRDYVTNPSTTILDFGCGKHALHVIDLKNLGYDITGYDFGNNVGHVLIDPKALSRKYDVVYASNVLNVQNSEKMMYETLSDVCKCVNGEFICNIPPQPRKGVFSGMSVKEGNLYLESVLKMFFKHVDVIKHGIHIIMICKGVLG